VVAVLAAGLLFVLPIDWGRRQFTLNWNQASRDRPGQVHRRGPGQHPERLQPGSITIVYVVIAVIISETTSNTASAAIVVPIAIAISGAVQVDPVIPALAAIFGANYGFMLPVSTPPNAIVYSSGMLPITRMVKTGAIFDVIGVVLCVVGVAVMANVVGLV
jgi:solute carrier family 13 (sodium-dependent dicarboxylate transporter), member 2/3/5